MPVLSKRPWEEFESGRTEGDEAPDKLCGGRFSGAGVTWLPAGVAAAEELIVLLFGGGVFAISELLSWEAVSSTCSWEELPC